MNFASFDFWVYLSLGSLLIGAGRVWVIRRRFPWLSHYDRVSLLLLSVSLLFRESPVTLAAFIFVSSVVWAGIHGLRHCRPTFQRFSLGLLVALALVPLFYFKYARFVLTDVVSLSVDLWHMVIIPAGLSFYSFQLIGYMADCTKAREPEKPALLDYLNFASFFPQIVAGPIERGAHLLPQMRSFSWGLDARSMHSALPWIVYGFFLKLAIADNLAEQSGWIGDNLTNPFQIWLGNLLFAYRIYFDFAGYSFIAIGLGKWLGIELTINFRSPFTALNIQDFWRRWHITLSAWFRDYVYVPLGGGHPEARIMRNILTVFVLSGIWHGAGWNFILWGAFHKNLLCLYRALRGRLNIPTPVSWFCCYLAVLVSWLFFYEQDTAQLLSKCAILVDPRTYTPQALRDIFNVLFGLGHYATLLVALGMAVSVHIAEWVSYRRHGDHAMIFLHPAATAGMTCLTVILAPTTDNGFIYFNF
jgi:alginate O-acetyltransferase complex protein AlgI